MKGGIKLNLYGHKVNQLARNFTKKLNEKIAPLGLYSSQWGIILYLHEKAVYPNRNKSISWSRGSNNY